MMNITIAINFVIPAETPILTFPLRGGRNKGDASIPSPFRGRVRVGVKTTSNDDVGIDHAFY
jgi:hypothetical protein